MNNEYEKMKNKESCPAVGYQDIDVCVPVTIKPFGNTGNVKTQCLGNAVVVSGCDKCFGKPGGVCKLSIQQKLRVEVPVIFGAKVEIGEASVECEDKKCSECDKI